MTTNLEEYSIWVFITQFIKFRCNNFTWTTPCSGIIHDNKIASSSRNSGIKSSLTINIDNLHWKRSWRCKCRPPVCDTGGADEGIWESTSYTKGSENEKDSWTEHVWLICRLYCEVVLWCLITTTVLKMPVVMEYKIMQKRRDDDEDVKLPAVLIIVLFITT